MRVLAGVLLAASIPVGSYAVFRGFSDASGLAREGVAPRYCRVVLQSSIAGGLEIIVACLCVWVQVTNLWGMRSLGWFLLMPLTGVVLATCKIWNTAWNTGQAERQAMWSAIALGTKGDWRSAFQQIKQAVEADPSNPVAYYCLASVQRELRSWDDVAGSAAKGLGLGIAHRFWSAMLYISLGESLVMLDKEEDALEALKKALSLGDRYPVFPADLANEMICLLVNGRGHEYRDAMHKSKTPEERRGLSPGEVSKRRRKR